MMVISFVWGQKVYKVPYATKKLLGYFSVMLLFYYINMAVCLLTPRAGLHMASGTVFLLLYLRFVYEIERKELRSLPVLGKWVR